MRRVCKYCTASAICTIHVTTTRSSRYTPFWRFSLHGWSHEKMSCSFNESYVPSVQVAAFAEGHDDDKIWCIAKIWVRPAERLFARNDVGMSNSEQQLCLKRQRWELCALRIILLRAWKKMMSMISMDDNMWSTSSSAAASALGEALSMLIFFITYCTWCDHQRRLQLN